jgi:hypothetical protein
MKKIFGLVVIIAIGYLGYSHFFNKPLSPDEREFKRIEDVINTVEGLKKELADLKDRVADDKLLQKVEDLGSKIEKFLIDKH